MAAFFEFENQIKFIGNNICLIDEIESLTYAQVYSEISQLKKLLRGNSNQARSLAYFEISNSMGGLIIYLTLLSLKYPFILNDKANSLYSNRIIESYDPEYLIVDKALENIEYSLTYKYKNFYIYKKQTPAKFFLNTSVAVLMLTSGSTGSPKSCAISYENLIHSANQICHSLQIVETDRAITTLPASYVYGISIINSHINQFSSIFLSEKSVIDPAFWSLIGQYGVNNFGGVPFQFEAIRKIFKNNIRLDGIRYLTQAGGRLSLETLEYFKKNCCKNNVKFFVMYGQTEATSRMSVNEITDNKNPIESIGKGLVSSSISIEAIATSDEDSSNLIGEIIYVGENVFLGYCDSIEGLNKLPTASQGVLRTGDLGIEDENGYLYIKGRKKRIVKIDGIRISLDEIEATYSTLGYEVIALCQGDHKIILVTNCIAVDELKRILLDKTNIKNRTVEFRLIDDFPLAVNNKIDYGKLQKIVEDDAIRHL
jgi:acyl-CoA synthetase (AMP-forming)/AMP-acid ligase II